MNASERLLFRPEVLRHRSDLTAGKPLRITEAGDLRVVIGLVALALSMLVLAACVPIGTTLGATGMVSAADGFTYVSAPLSGHVAATYVGDGKPVRAAQPLFVLRADHDDSQGSASDANARSLDRRLQANRGSREQSIQSARQELQLAHEEEQQAGRSIINLKQQLDLQARRITLQQEQLQLEEKFVAEGFMSKSSLVGRRDTVMDLQQRREEIERALWDAGKAQIGVRARVTQLTAKLASERAGLTVVEEELKQQQRDNRSRSEALVLATTGGVFDSFRISAGSFVREGQALGAIHEPGAPNVVELFIPSSSSALPKVGMTVSMTTRLAGSLGTQKQLLRGKVARIGSVAAPGRNFSHLPVTLAADQNYFHVYVELAPGSADLAPVPPGTAVDARIELARRTFVQSVMARATPGS